MKTVNELIPGSLAGIEQRKHSTRPLDEGRIKLLRESLEKLSNWKLLNTVTAQTLKDWADSLSELSNMEIQVGMKKAENHTGYFSLPVFKDLCKLKPQDYGLPDVEQAYHEACCAQNVLTFRWSHPAVYHAGADTGWFDLRNGVGDAKNRFQQNYWKRFQQVQGNVLPPIPKHELLENRKGKARPEIREKYLNKIYESFGRNHV